MPSLRLLPCVLALAFAVALAGCGEGDDDGSGGRPAASSDEREIRDAVEGLYDDLADYDAEGVCSRMSPTARRQIAQGAIGTKGSGGGCPKAFGRFLDMAKRQGGLEQTLNAKVGKVAVTGRDARVTVSFGAQSGEIPLRKLGGEWKVGIAIATPSVDSGGAAAPRE